MSETQGSCSRAATIAVLRVDELSAGQSEHVATCAACRAELDATARAIELARSLDEGPVEPARSELVRKRLLESARRQPPRRSETRGWAIALVAAASLLVVGVGAHFAFGDDPAAPSLIASASAAHGTVRASSGAQFTQLSDAPDEIVRLVSGTISVSVTPLGEGERFRVVVGDGEVEVRGTAFEVGAEADRLDFVRVLHGAVEVRLTGHPAVQVNAADRWTRPLEPTDAEQQEASAIDDVLRTEPTRAVAPSPTRVRARPEASTTESAADSPATTFERAWASLRANDPSAAATSFDEVTTRWPSDPLAEEASFWGAVALSRASRPAQARAALAEFVTRHPESARCGTAAVMLGWLLVEAAEPDAARAQFARALLDPSTRVRASAERGVASLGGDLGIESEER